jgi:hypothetical protein
MIKIRNIFATMLMASAISFVSVTASAALVDININGVESWDAFDDVDNTIMLVDLGMGSPVIIDGIGWDVTISTEGASWLSEAVITFGSTADAGLIDVTTGFGEDFAGSMSFSSGGILSLFDNGLPDMFLADGILRLQFSESFDDIDGEVDAIYEGFVSVSTVDAVVSAPSMLALFTVGLIGVNLVRRSKSV